jgi:radical SAM protein with 4Fe4S-binding SPASM domain
MCLVRYRPPIDRMHGSVTTEQLTFLLQSVPSIRRLTLQGLGEPTLAPGLLDMISQARRRDIEVGFNTNGTLLTHHRCEQLVDAGVEWLHVSVDGATAATFERVRDGARLDKVLTNLATLMEVRRTSGRKRPFVQLNFVAMRSNFQELPDVVRLAARLGVDRCWIQTLSHDFSDTDPSGSYLEIRSFAERESLPPDDAVWQRALRAAQAVAAGAQLELRLPQTDTGATRRDDEPACDWPWRSAYVTHDGDVQPCCMVMGSDRARFGNLREQSFTEIWHSPEYQALRRQLLTDVPPNICRGCSVYRRTF